MDGEVLVILIGNTQKTKSKINIYLRKSENIYF